MLNSWVEIERIGERILEAQAAEAEAWRLYVKQPTGEFLSHWRIAREQVNKLINERDRLVRENFNAASE